MARIKSRAATAHEQAVTYGIADIARFLQEQFGQRLTAYIAGVSDPKLVGKWAAGQHVPRSESERRLRAAFQIFHVLQQDESAYTARAWFIGMNPQLDDDSPAEAIRDGRLKDAMIAAKAYIAGG